MSPVRDPADNAAGRRQAHRSIKALPPRIAEIDAPLPRCATISFSGTFGCSGTQSTRTKCRGPHSAAPPSPNTPLESAYASPPRAWCDESKCREWRSSDSRKQLQSLAHDVNRNRRMQRRKRRVTLHLVDQRRRDELVLLHRRPAANHAMPDGRRSREIAGMKRVGNQLKSHGAVGRAGV